MGLISLAFMQRALLAAFMTGLIAPAIGTYLVQRRLSLLGDGLGHVAIAGVGLAIATGTAPIPVAVVVCILGAVIVELLREVGKTSGDVAMAMIFYGGLAAGLILAGFAGQGPGTLAQFMFGSLLTVSGNDVIMIVVLALVVIIPSIGLAPRLFAVCADESYARVLGLPVRAYNLLIAILAATTVAISMRTVGLLLASALMVVPVATANNMFLGFRKAMVGSMMLGVTAALGGVFGSYYLNVVPGAFIVVIAIGLFVLSLPLASRLQRRRVPVLEIYDGHTIPRDPVKVYHEHVHGPGCGHQLVIHGDHQGYVHDGRLHTPHGDHYDEH